MDSAAASLDSRKRRLSSEGVGSATAMNASTSIGSPDRGGMSMESRADLVDGQTEGRDAASRRRGSGLGNAAFVIVDVQNDFISGSLAVSSDLSVLTRRPDLWSHLCSARPHRPQRTIIGTSIS